MEGVLRQFGALQPGGAAHSPEDADRLTLHRADHRGQILREGINKAGAFSAWLAAATACANHSVAMMPFSI